MDFVSIFRKVRNWLKASKEFLRLNKHNIYIDNSILTDYNEGIVILLHKKNNDKSIDVFSKFADKSELAQMLDEIISHIKEARTSKNAKRPNN